MKTHHLMQFFAYDHLREDLQGTSKKFAELAHFIVETLPENTEQTIALRKLLEAKDSAVRSVIYRPIGVMPKAPAAPTPAAGLRSPVETISKEEVPVPPAEGTPPA